MEMRRNFSTAAPAAARGGNKGAHQEKKSFPLPPSSGQDDQGRGNDRRKGQEGANNRGGNGRQSQQRSPGESGALAGLSREARRSDLIYKNKPFKTLSGLLQEL